MTKPRKKPRTHTFGVRLTPDEVAQITKLADANDETPTAWARRLILRALRGEL